MHTVNKTQQQQQIPQENLGGWIRDKYGNKIWVPWRAKKGRGHHHNHNDQNQVILYNQPQQQQMNNNRPYNTQQQQQQQQQYYTEEDGSSEGYGAFDEDTEGQPNSSLGASVDATTNTPVNLPPHLARFKNMTQQELEEPAKLKLQTVVFEASREIRMSQLLGKDMKLKNNGTVVFSRENGHLEPIQATCQKHVFGVPLTQARNDLVSGVEVKIWGNYNKKLLVSLPTIGAIGDEHFRDGANHVNFTIPAGSLSENKPYTVSFERDITNGQIAFATVFDSPSPDTMDAGIAHVAGRGISYVPLNHAIVHYWNADPANRDNILTEETVDVSPNGDIIMETTNVEKYLTIAKKGVNSNLSLGNVTTNTMVVISACEPTESKQMTLRANANGASKQVTSFMGLADSNYYLGKNATQTAKDRFLDTPFRFDMELTFKYVKLDGTPIEHAK